MKRLVAIAALVFASGLMTEGGVLACLYRMPDCGKTPACHHQENTKIKPASCCRGIAPGRTVSVPSSRFILAIPSAEVTNAPLLTSIASPGSVAAILGFDASPPVLTLRV